MATPIIHPAETEADFAAVRVLCTDWVDWHLEAYPEQRWIIDRVFDPAHYAQTVADLHVIHARPKGNILLIDAADAKIGCGMYFECAPGIAEIKRVFVRPEAHGQGLGMRLLDALFAHMRADGYNRAQLSSGRFLTHARGLYDRVGFREIALPKDYPPDLRDSVYFMEKPL